MNRDDAKAAVLKQLEQRGVGAPDGVVVIESATIEKPYGWIFFYNSRRYVETGELVHALVGQGPVIVVAATGAIIELGSAIPSAAAIKEAEQRFNLQQ
jgi:hypothetical protein